MTAVPYRIHVDDAVLVDLHARLERSRLLPNSPRRPRSGMDAAYLAELVGAWVRFDWRRQERALNGHQQWIAQAGGLQMHVVERRASREDAPAVLVMHGWPHTFAMQLPLLEALPTMHVVIASIPGFAFSPPADRPLDEHTLIGAMRALMVDVLGYERFLVYGEDVSAIVADGLAAWHPDHAIGLLVTHPRAPADSEQERFVDDDSRAYRRRAAAAHVTDGAYGHVQATRPDTLAASLNDSPAGLLGWLVEKYVEWTIGPGASPCTVEARIGRARLLTEATIWWATQSIASSFRPYYEGADRHGAIPPVEVACGLSINRHVLGYPVAYARAFYPGALWTETLFDAGHFTAAEAPHQVAARLRRLSDLVW